MTEKISTQLQWTAEIAKRDKAFQFMSLARYIDVDWLRESYRRLKDGKAPGVDNVTKDVYGKNLNHNLEELHERLKEGRYRAPSVRRVMIPKEGGERPLGLPTLEDKIVQGAVRMMLESIYEQDFYDCSYGFRPKRNCHQAINAIREQCSKKGIRWIIDADISKCFDSFSHKHLQEMLSIRVKDGSIKRLIGKWLNAGILTENNLSYPDAGTPQGGVISPLLANIYLHYVLDEWFVKEVKPRCRGNVFLIRYADDFVIGCSEEIDANRIMEVLPKRFEKYALQIHSEKTQLIDFNKPDDEDTKGGGSFAFLGFRMYWGRNRNGFWVVKKKTDKKRLARVRKNIHTWCKINRHKPIKYQYQVLRAKLLGHYQYYGVIGNYASLSVVYNWTHYCWWKWLSRRGSRHGIPWSKFKVMPFTILLPAPKIVHAI